ncbi:MAG: phosphotransferase [Candidatus Limnocylindrales bacterium]
MSSTIEDVIAAIPEWQGRRIEARLVAGGLTNANYRVEVDGTPFFVRIPGPATELLAVDRGNERHNTAAAAAAGVGPRVIHEVRGMAALVLEWLPGTTMSNAAFAAPGMPTRIAETLRRLHAGPRFRDDFDMFRLTEFYLAVVDERAIAIPAGYRQRLGLMPRIAAALAVRPLATVPCHNDLLAENYLDDGTRLWIVDYEYSGNNDPTFELGNTCLELGYDADRVAELCTAYFGAAPPQLLARLHLQMIMSDIGWTLWAAIQAQVSTIDYDFWGWAQERWARAAEKLDSAAFGIWLREAAAEA